MEYVDDAMCFEESPADWRVRYKQVRRWACGHNQCLFRYLWKTLTAKDSHPRGCDAALVLVFFMFPTLSLIGLAAAMIYPTLYAFPPFNFAVISAFSFVVAFGNFSPYFQIVSAVLRDRQPGAVVMLPSMFAFVRDFDDRIDPGLVPRASRRSCSAVICNGTRPSVSGKPKHMQLLEFHLPVTGALSWPIAGGAPLIEMFAAPALLLAIIVVHIIYYFRLRGSDGQQVIALSDLSDLDPAKCAALGEKLTLVKSWGEEFDARNRVAERTHTLLMMPLTPLPAQRGATVYHATSQRLVDRLIRTPLICAEDLVVDGSSQFLGPVKVGGDLIVRGEATFAQVVVVNGVLKIEGEAQFAVGVLAKGDTFVTGSITIGSDRGEGWAALREFALRTRLRLNGRIVTARAVQLREAA